jgi:Domain of unknown function (DUF4123)
MNCNPLISLLALNKDEAVYSLIDGAQAPELVHVLRNNSTPGVRVLPLIEQEDAAWVGPVLIAHDYPRDCSLLREMANMAGSGGYMSILQYSADLESLRDHLAWLTDVAHADNSQWVMRYYDPRLLPEWASVLTEEQRKVAFAGVKAWFYMDLDGVARELQFPKCMQILGNRGSAIKFSEQQCSDILTRCTPIMLASLVSQDLGLGIWGAHEEGRYAFAKRSIANAADLGIVEFSDQKTFILLSLAYGESFYCSPYFRQLWSTRSGTNLGDLVTQMDAVGLAKLCEDIND